MLFIVFVTVTFTLFLFVYARYLKANNDIQNRRAALDLREARVSRMVDVIKSGNERLREKVRDVDERIGEANKLLEDRQG